MFNRPKLPTHYYVWSEPPDHSGDEALYFASAQRRIKIKGHSFREFEQYVIPLLDGRHTFQEIADSVADVFDAEDLAAGLRLLAEQHLLTDSDASTPPSESLEPLAPQLNFFYEMSTNPEEVQSRLQGATVTVFGLGNAGASTAIALAAARVGQLRCVDFMPVGGADTYLSNTFSQADAGQLRAEVVAQRLAAKNPEVSVTIHTRRPESDDDVLALVDGSNFVINCLDAGESSLIYKLNRVCLRAGIKWTSCALSGPEIILGPTIHPEETACYLCYKMRSVSCAGNPEDEFAFESFLDQRKQDDSARHENLVSSVDLAAGLASLEAIKSLSGVFAPSAVGKIVVLNLLDLTSTKHVVLRKPWCPACFKTTAQAGGEPQMAAAAASSGDAGESA
ncbi:MAG TPA: TOMM precursor leader peptide-binding protein [Pyrinomonadaceae bacterium]|nr:TOMM precursor leader peptide-binding protein [Pyrinomonadaceae bacterium]